MQPEITVSAELIAAQGEDLVNILVRDNGIGFRENDSERIFNTFARLNSKDQFEGNGPGGWRCVKKIVQAA